MSPPGYINFQLLLTFGIIYQIIEKNPSFMQQRDRVLKFVR